MSPRAGYRPGAPSASSPCSRCEESRARKRAPSVRSAHVRPVYGSTAVGDERASGLDIEPANRIWLRLQHGLAHLSSRAVHLFSERDHALHASDPAAIVNAIQMGAAMVRDAPPPPALGLPGARLPAASTAEVDRLLLKLEEAYRAMDADRFVALFTGDVVQLDVPRRVHVKGREPWFAWTRILNAAHQRMSRSIAAGHVSATG
jgi:hypothetical protein